MRSSFVVLASATAALAFAAGMGGFYLWRAAESVSEPSTLSQPSTGVDLRFIRLDAPRPVPALGFTDGNGRSMSLADFRGRAVLLNIWATWCAPCRKEMPTLDHLQAMLGGPEFEVVALSIDRKGKEAVEPFYKELGLNSLGIYLDQPGKAPYALNTIGVPTTLLIDREGREVARKMGPAEWDSDEMTGAIRQYLRPARSADAANAKASADSGARLPAQIGKLGE